MKIPVSWIKEYIDFNTPLDELAHKLTMQGIESVVIEDSRWSKVSVAVVKDIIPHPNADKLYLVKVAIDSNNQEVEVVCGANNIFKNQKVAYAAIGAELIDPKSDDNSKMYLKKSKIRGIVSEGMLCSPKELGLGEDHEGIVTLPENFPIGKPLIELLAQHYIDFSITPNRTDCTSIIGIAREITHIAGATLKMPSVTYKTVSKLIGNTVRVEIKDPDLCHRYIAAVILGVNIAPSPKWLADRLIAVGERPINNIVDITNYVMWEYGQPLHAFDLDTISQNKIIVRRSVNDEKITTLNGVEHTLTGEELMIADPQKSIGVAGVMGSKNSSITSKTTNLLIESATFNSVAVRKSARKLAIESAASKRFERGLHTKLAEQAIKRAIHMILTVAGGNCVENLIDNYPGRVTEIEAISLHKSTIKKLLGINIPPEKIEDILISLGFKLQETDYGWRVTLPWWRTDVSIQEDLCEEIIRIIGYDSIPTKMLIGTVPIPNKEYSHISADIVKDIFVQAGMQEIITYSAIAKESEVKLNLDPSKPAVVALRNPVSNNHSIMRRTLRSGIIETIAKNSNQRTPIAVFECGNIFYVNNNGVPTERLVVAGAFAGQQSQLYWANSTNRDADFFDAKGAVEFFAQSIGANVEFEPAEDSTFIPGRTALIRVNGKNVGRVGEIKYDILDKFNTNVRSASIFEIYLDALTSKQIVVKPISKMPETIRDIAVVVEKRIPTVEITKTILQNKLVSNATIFDIYKGPNIPSDKHSIAIRIVMQKHGYTLSAKEVNRSLSSISREIKRKYQAEIR